MLVGVLALQGAFKEHGSMIKKCGCSVQEVSKNSHLEKLDGLIIPGGESTTIIKLLEDYKLFEPIREKCLKGMPVFGTGAGMIILAKNILDFEQKSLGLMDIEVVRNGYGQGKDSFEVDLNISALGEKPFRGIFIKAPYIKSVEPQVGIMAEYDGKGILARQGNLLVCSFHPELTDDDRIHRYFLNMVSDAQKYDF